MGRPAKAKRRGTTSSSEALGSPRRSLLLSLVRERPGSRFGALQRAAGLGTGVFYHHVGKLVEAGLVRVLQDGRRRLLFAVGEVGPDEVVSEAEAADALRLPVARRIAEAVLRNPGTNVRAIVASDPDLSSRLVYYHLRRLVATGLVKTGVLQRYVDLAPTPRLIELLGERGARHGSRKAQADREAS